MSFEEAWFLPKPVTTYSSDDLVARVRALLPAGVQVSVHGESDDARAITIDFPASLVDAIAAKLSAREGQLDWDWRDDLDPPREGDAYSVDVDFVDDEHPLIRIYSNDGDNREAWPIVLSIASSLAEDLGAIAEEDFDADGKNLN